MHPVPRATGPCSIGPAEGRESFVQPREGWPALGGCEAQEAVDAAGSGGDWGLEDTCRAWNERNTGSQV